MKMNYTLKNYLNKNWSSQLKGIAILFVILNHFRLNINAGTHFGTWGVSIFLILSGFGLTQSYLKSGINNFFKKRLSKVILPYCVVTLIWVTLEICMGKTRPIIPTILELIGINLKINVDVTLDKSMWYITFILIWYLVFYVTFKTIKNDNIKIIIMFVFSIVLFKYRDIIFHSDTRAGIYIFNFPIGTLLGLYYSKLLNIKKKKLLISQIFICVISFTLFVIAYKYFHSEKASIIEHLLFSSLFISFLGILSMYSFKLNIIEFIGNISYEIYLFEYVLINNYGFIFRLNINIWIERLIFFIVIISLGFIYQKFIKATENIWKLNNQINNITINN